MQNSSALFNFLCSNQSELDSGMVGYYTSGDMARRTSRTRTAPMYYRIPIIPGWLYVSISRSGVSLSFGKSSVGRASVSQRGVRINKSIAGFNIGKTFSFSKIGRLFGQGKNK